MAKIPKNLSDKDMLKNWVEESSVEDQFMAAEKKAKQAGTRAAAVAAAFAARAKGRLTFHLPNQAGGREHRHPAEISPVTVSNAVFQRCFKIK